MYFVFEEFATWKLALAVVASWIVFFLMELFGIFVFDQYFNILIVICNLIIVATFACLCAIRYQIVKECANITNRRENQPMNIQDVQMILQCSRISKSILISFSICFIPWICIGTATLLNIHSIPLYRIYIQPWLIFAGSLNSLTDPLVYCFRLQSVKDYLKNLFVNFYQRFRRINRVEEVRENPANNREECQVQAESVV